MDQLVEQFRMLSIKRWEHLRMGNSKLANSCSDKLREIFTQIKAAEMIDQLTVLCDDQSDEVRFESAQRLLPYYTVVSQKIIAEIATKSGLLSFEAEQTLKWWTRKNQG